MNRLLPAGLLASVALATIGSGGPAPSQAAKASYAEMAPIDQYRIASRDEEIALARSAAPPSISADAEVLVLGPHAYETAVKGKNGFVCFVERSWAAGVDQPEFWNPKLRAPNCFNAAAARSELTQYLKRTEWVLAGATKQQIVDKTQAAVASREFRVPEEGSISYMMSKQGYLGDEAGGPWLPHVMVFLPHGQSGSWGANMDGVPVFAQEGRPTETTVIFIPVRIWSDGSPAPPPATKHSM